MKTTKEPITGSETHETKTTPYEALIEFYDAFNNGKMELMSNNWANSPEIAMDNPLGGIVRGWSKIKEVYSRLFNGSAKVYVEFYDYTIHEKPEMFYAVGRERGFFQLNGNKIDLEIRTSRIFERIENQWRQVHHHGSIEKPELLHKYQSAINNK
ncbi:YybH family protein [Mariniflexile sp. HMF6888]|uniref:YybH family protein n=1 Tax=Mariniflexile sp. HMF6888 TaxID=3373086 RepID=UPI0037B4443E